MEDISGSLLPSLGTVAAAAITLYTLSVIVFIISENRSPQSTFAWMLLLLIFPVGGVLIYFLFGRSWRAFSREKQFVYQDLGRELTQGLGPIIARQEERIREVQQKLGNQYVKLLELVYNNSFSALTVHNDAEILQDAREKYPRLLEDIRQARHSIHLEYYIWQTDPFTIQLKDLLIEKARSGVEVRLLYDAVGSFRTLKRWYKKELQAGGVQVHPYSPVLRLHTIGYRNHRKIAVIDGKIGYTGGLNIGQEHLDGSAGFKSWRDTHLRLTGEAARVLQGLFVTHWYYATKEKLTHPSYFPPLEEPYRYLPIQIITSGPDSQWAAIRQLYFLMIVAAQDHIYLQSPFFILDASIAEALKAVALAGVDVKVMLAPRGVERSQIPYWAANTYIREMVRAGVRVFFYEDGYFHAKTMSIDSTVCTIGTANMDIRSFGINYEINAVIYDRQMAAELEADFRRDLTHCREFNLREYEEGPFLLRFRDSVARLFSPLL
ncbi:cardiolipin synthase [Litorilinea aerophila]|uniref:Cardiolipin synthase n=1 Tax=Litorilinea aerophila TaxID=1204385 RepID=A0A540VJ35_9CHLR|nr:cardiolipin synthase [Litorilinea aerophila]MCC9075650.1 cardiolipin synthase [Litorilinea aerophila]GIV80255.1 MAG: major cardiolipin synthase ClsA [Litorilinea sp.]